METRILQDRCRIGGLDLRPVTGSREQTFSSLRERFHEIDLDLADGRLGLVVRVTEHGHRKRTGRVIRDIEGAKNHIRSEIGIRRTILIHNGLLGRS